MTATDQPTGEVVELLSAMIRNRCVNDGTPEQGHERRNAELLADHLSEQCGRAAVFELTAPEDAPHRASLVARLEGTDPSAPTLLLLAHTDVVPVHAEDWSRDPFGGEVVDGELWGRGAVDMLNQTAAMAAAFRRLSLRPTPLPGSLLFAAVADEEAGGFQGIGHILDTEPDLVAAEVVLTEAGGTVSQTRRGPRLAAMVGEKGMVPMKLTISGRAGHGSLPLLADNALITAAEVVRRVTEIRSPAVINDVWRRWVTETVDDDELRSLLLDPAALDDAARRLPDEHAATAHACTHTTYSPNHLLGTTKSNVIPGEVTLIVDVRAIGDETPTEIAAILSEALVGLPVTIESEFSSRTSMSPTDTPMWAVLERAVRAAYPDGGLVPSLFTGGTDGRYFRERGIPAYGFGVLSRAMPPARYWSYFHGHDERIDLESLRLSTEAWEHVAIDYLG